MNIILSLLLLVLIFMLLILFSPVKYDIKAKYEDEFNYSVKIWSGFLFRFELHRPADKNGAKPTILGLSWPERKRKPASNQTKPAHKQKTSYSALKTLQSFLENRMQISLWRLLKQLVTAFKPDNITITGRYGFYEPHLTAWVLPCLSILDSIDESYKVDLHPVWDQEALQIYLKIAGSITPAALLAYIAMFILQVSTWRFLLAIKRNKKPIKHHTVQPF